MLPPSAPHSFPLTAFGCTCALSQSGGAQVQPQTTMTFLKIIFQTAPSQSVRAEPSLRTAGIGTDYETGLALGDSPAHSFCFLFLL